MQILKALISKIFYFLFAVLLTFTTPINANNKDVYDPRSFPQIDADQKTESTVRVVSFNIRCTDVNGEPAASRYGIVVEEVKKLDPDLCGMQEVTSAWRDQIIKKLGGTYDIIGEKRDDDPNGEYNLILYKKDSYELLQSGTFWLSETPDIMSKGWDGACNRICTYAKLREKSTGKLIVHLNTHLDYKGKDARKFGAQLITDFIEKNYKDLPVILTGDFNDYETSAAYREITSSGLKNARRCAETKECYGTYHDAKPILQPFYTIDFIFVSPQINVSVYKTVTVGVNNRFVSDHFPIYADITF